jgi:hypothetical protein
MPNTTVELHRNADFSQRNIGYIDPEPPIYIPGSPFANFRLGFSLSRSLKNRVAGEVDGVTGGTITLSGDKLKAQAAASSTISIGGTRALPLSFAVVFKQEAAAVNQTLAGRPSSGGSEDAAGVCVAASGNLSAVVRSVAGGFGTPSLAKDGGDRYEFLAASFDNSGGPGASVIKLWRPRTATLQQTNTATMPASITTSRVLGATTGTLTSAVEGVRALQWANRVLTDQEVLDMYASWKESLATSGIII